MIGFKQATALILGSLFLFFSLNYFAVDVKSDKGSRMLSTEESNSFFTSQQVNIYAFIEQRSETANISANSGNQNVLLKLPSWVAALENPIVEIAVTFYIYIKVAQSITLRLQSHAIAFPFHEFW